MIDFNFVKERYGRPCLAVSVSHKVSTGEVIHALKQMKEAGKLSPIHLDDLAEIVSPSDSQKGPFYCHVVDTPPGTHPHGTLEAAEQEAERLAKKTGQLVLVTGPYRRVFSEVKVVSKGVPHD